MTRIAGRAPVRFTEEHKKFIRLYHKDKTYGQFARLFDVSESTISGWCLHNGIKCKSATKTGGKQKENELSIEDNIQELVSIHKNSIYCCSWLNETK